MKKILAILLVIGVLIAAGAALVVKYLDLDKIKARVIESAEAALGQDVELGGLSIYFRSGLNLRVSDLKVTGRGEFAGEPLIFMPDAYFRVNIRALLNKEVRIEHVVFEGPEITVVKTRDGRLNTSSVAASSAGSGRMGSAQSGIEGDGKDFQFLTSRFIVRNGSFRYLDRSGPAPAEFALADIDAEVRDISLDRPVMFVVKAAALESAAQNLELSGKVGPLGETRDLSRLYASVRLSLDSVDMGRLKSKLPNLRDVPFSGQPFKGTTVAGAIKNPVYAPTGELIGFTGNLDVDAASIQPDFFREPLQAVKLRLTAQGESMLLEKGEAAIGKGKIAFSGECRNFLTRRRSTALKAALRGIEVHDVVPIGRSERDFSLYGQLNADLQLAFAGTKQAEITQSMTGFGQLEITKGLVQNLNVLANVMSKIASIPFIGADIVGLLSPRYRALLSERDMRVDLAQSRFTIGAGEARVEEIHIQGDSVTIQGSGHVSLLGRLRLACALFLSPELSNEIITGFPDLQVLTDQSRRLILPFSVGGEIASPKVVVDREFLMTRILPQAGQRVLQNVLGDGSSKAADTASGAASKASQFLDQLLKQ